MSGLFAINWGTLFVLVAIYGGTRFFLRPKTEHQDKINWTPLESVGVTLTIYFLGQIFGALLLYIFPMLFGVKQSVITDWASNNVYGQFLFVLAVETITMLLIIKFLKNRKSNLKAIGLNRKPKLKDIGYVFIGFGIYFLVFTVILALLKNVFPALNSSQQQVLGFDNARGLQLVFVFISLVALPPIVEEVLTRGFLYSGLKKGMHIIIAATITSLLFATAHLQPGSGNPLLWNAALDTFILSYVLIYLKEQTGSLWASIGLHMLKNCIAFLALFVFHVS